MRVSYFFMMTDGIKHRTIVEFDHRRADVFDFDCTF